MKQAKLNSSLTVCITILLATTCALAPEMLQAQVTEALKIAKCGAPVVPADAPAPLAKTKGVGPPRLDQIVIDGGLSNAKKAKPLHYSAITADMRAKNPRLRGPDSLPVVDASSPGARLAARPVFAGPECVTK
jgi:hypothetical protein